VVARRKRRILAVVLGSIALVLLAAPHSLAAMRFAAPADVGAGNCSSAADACDLQDAVESAGMNDEVILKSDTYNEGTNPLAFPANNLNVHGEAGMPKPVLNFTDITETGMPFPTSEAVKVTAGSSVSWLRIVSADPTVIGHNALFANGAQIERVEIEAVGNACLIQGPGALLRDSFCRTSGSAISTVTGGDGVKLRNVTAKATGSAAGVTALASGGNATVDARNVIADGSPDAQAVNLGGTATLTLSYSNYATTSGASVTPAGSATNQTAPPMLGANLFTQLPSSMTINAGATDMDTGPMDIDGEPRSQGTAIDIGADEFPGNPPPPGGGGGGTTPTNPVTPGSTAQPAAPTCSKTKKKKKKRSAAAAKKKKKKKKC
jgi:hypothetical protein